MWALLPVIFALQIKPKEEPRTDSVNHVEFGVDAYSSVSVCSSSRKLPTPILRDISVIAKKAFDFLWAREGEPNSLGYKRVAVFAEPFVMSRAKSTCDFAVFESTALDRAFTGFHIPTLRL